VSAAVTNGHLPRVLELVQFLSVYCTSLSSQQQSRIHNFQIASFFGTASLGSDVCAICPGRCIKPMALVLPTFAMVSCLAALTALVLVFDACHRCGRHGPSVAASPVQDPLLESDYIATTSTTRRQLRPRQVGIVAAFMSYFRGFIETCSSFVLIPCVFVCVLNMMSSTFALADNQQRFMLIMIPTFALLIRTLVIQQRLVELTRGDQIQLLVSSACNCGIAAAFSVYFARDKDFRLAYASYPSSVLPQYMVLALLTFQLISHTFIRRNSSEESIFDNVDWPWHSSSTQASSAVFSFRDLRSRLVIGSVKRTARSVAASILKFVILNYLILSQMAMVIAGLVSLVLASPIAVDAASVLIGTIPLVISSVLLLHSGFRFAKFLCKKFVKRSQKLESSHGSHSFMESGPSSRDERL
jgi:hypothetical protein